MSRKLKYPVNLSSKERSELESFVHKGSHSSRVINRAWTLLYRDRSEGRLAKNQQWIALHLGLTQSTIYQICRRYCEGGILEALYDKPRSGRPHALVGRQNAELTALACSDAPEGHERWTHRLLAEHFVQLECTDRVSASTVGRVLKKMNSNRGKGDNGVLGL